MSERDTRGELLKAGVALFLEGGYDHAGTNAILARAHAPRGCFYHHFEDKQAFALAAAEYYYEQHLPVLDRLLTTGPSSALTRLRRYFEAMASSYRDVGWRGGCLLGLLSQELADREPAARKALATLFGRWRSRIAAVLREAKEEGSLARHADCDELAGFLIDAWEGALLQMKLKKSGEPLQTFVRVTFSSVLPKP